MNRNNHALPSREKERRSNPLPKAFAQRIQDAIELNSMSLPELRGMHQPMTKPQRVIEFLQSIVAVFQSPEHRRRLERAKIQQLAGKLLDKRAAERSDG